MTSKPAMTESSSDALVIFGITGDLAKKMTFQALYHLEIEGLLDFPIIGVAIEDWSLDELRSHVRAALESEGEHIKEATFNRLAGRLTYVQGDFTAAATYDNLKKELASRSRPLYYLETPPSLFAPIVVALGQA